MRVLMVTYLFPPTGGVGTERVRKLAKYLPDHGIEPIILTARNPSVPLVDHSSLRDIRPGLRVLRASTLEPAYSVKQRVWASSSAGFSSEPPGSFFRDIKATAGRLARAALVPDPQVLWQPDVQRVLLTSIYRPRPLAEAVFITAPPFSSFLAAPIVRLRPSTAVILDYRDEWETTRQRYEMLSGRWAATAGAILEPALLRCAHAITTATEAFRQNLLTRFPFLHPDRVVAITNGYDPDDFPGDLPEPPSDRFVVTYAGTVYRLTSPRGFIAGLRLFHEREPSLARFLSVRFVGRVVDTELEAFRDTEQLGVTRVGFIPKSEVVTELARSHLVLCFQADEPGNERIYQAKIFELMHLGRPCLTIAPDGALKALVERHRLGPVLPPGDAEGVAQFLKATLQCWRQGRYSTRGVAVETAGYDRRAIAAQFAKVFRAAVTMARPTRSYSCEVDPRFRSTNQASARSAGSRSNGPEDSNSGGSPPIPDGTLSARAAGRARLAIEPTEGGARARLRGRGCFGRTR